LFIGLGIGSILSETAAITAGLLFLVLGFIITRLLDKYISAHNKYVSRVIRRI